jgi:hypothetical protein
MIITSLFPTRVDILLRYGVQTVPDTQPTGNLNGMDSQLLESMILRVLVTAPASSRLAVLESLKLIMNSSLSSSVSVQNFTIQPETFTMVLVGITSPTGMIE